MITETQFRLFYDKAMKFKYTSFGPLGYDDCLNAEVLQDTENAIVLYDGNRKPGQIHWASDDPQIIIKQAEEIKEAILIDFIPKGYMHVFEDVGFSVWAEYVDFFNNELEKTEISFDDYDSIRFLKPAEIPIIVRVSASCAGYARGFTGETEEWFQDWMKENDIIVVEKDDEIVGYCCVSIYASGTILWIREIGVNPSYHRKGFGKSLLERAIFYGIMRGAKRGFLHADAQNQNAINLYTKYGFVAKDAGGELQMIRK